MFLIFSYMYIEKKNVLEITITLLYNVFVIRRMKMNDYSFNLGRDREVNLSSRLKQTALENADKIAYYFMDEATTYSQFDKCCDEVC